MNKRTIEGPPKNGTKIFTTKNCIMYTNFLTKTLPIIVISSRRAYLSKERMVK
jgi:hypothetical protein